MEGNRRKKERDKGRERRNTQTGGGGEIPKHIKGETNEKKRNRSKERCKEYFGFITISKHACCPRKLEKIRKSVSNALLVMEL